MSRAAGAAPDGSNRPLPERIAELDAERTAIELATAGYTERQIADEMGCSNSTAHRRLVRGYQRLTPIRAAETRRAQAGVSGAFSAGSGSVTSRSPSR